MGQTKKNTQIAEFHPHQIRNSNSSKLKICHYSLSSCPRRQITFVLPLDCSIPQLLFPENSGRTLSLSLFLEGEKEEEKKRRNLKTNNHSANFRRIGVELLFEKG